MICASPLNSRTPPALHMGGRLSDASVSTGDFYVATGGSRQSHSDMRCLHLSTSGDIGWLSFPAVSVVADGLDRDEAAYAP